MYPLEPITPADLRAMLGIILAIPGANERAPAHHVSGFCEYLAHGPAQWEGLRCGSRQAPVAAFFALRLPGGTAIVMVPTPGELGIDPAEQMRITRTGLARLGERNLYYAQALLEPGATAVAALLEQVGFRPLAMLEYLERDALHPWVDPPTPDDVWAPAGLGDAAATDALCGAGSADLCRPTHKASAAAAATTETAGAATHQGDTRRVPRADGRHIESNGGAFSPSARRSSAKGRASVSSRGSEVIAEQVPEVLLSAVVVLPRAADRDAHDRRRVGDGQLFVEDEV